jgi:hypothetical protein
MVKISALCDEKKEILWLAGILFIYMFVLSSGPAGGVRFREQYFTIVVILAMPTVEWLFQVLNPYQKIKKAG